MVDAIATTPTGPGDRPVEPVVIEYRRGPAAPEHDRRIRTGPPTPAGDPAGVPTCYRHPDRETYIRCQRCGKPICPDCMRDAAVGFHCPDCVAEGRKDDPRRPARRTAGCGRRSHGVVSMTLIGINAAVWVADPGHRGQRQPSGSTGSRCGRKGLCVVRQRRLRRLATRCSAQRRHVAARRQRRRLVAAGHQRCSPTSSCCTSASTCSRCGCSGRSWSWCSAGLRFLALYLLSGLVGSAVVYWLVRRVHAHAGRLGRDLRPDGRAARGRLQGAAPTSAS